jgi:hypothetical protein
MSTNSYQFSLRTSRGAAAVLDEIAVRPLPGIAVAERGAHYLVLRPRRRYRYGSDITVGVAVVIVLAVLIATAWSPMFIVLLPLAVLPAVPLLLDRRRPDLAVSAVADDDGGTRVTVHGEASEELAAAVDAFLGALPEAPTIEEGSAAVASAG